MSVDSPEGLSAAGSRRSTILVVILLAVVSLIYCGSVLANIENWGTLDWDQHLFYNATVYRAITEFGELPLWNPWFMGGNPQLANPQIQFPTPMFALDLIAGPIVGMKLKIFLHHWIGLLGMFFLGRRLGMSLYGALLASAGFMLSNWYALHLYVGHSQFLSMAYMPWFVLSLRLALNRSAYAILAAFLMALMIFQGGIYTVIYTCFLSGIVSLAWSLQGRTLRPLIVLAVAVGFAGGLSAVKTLPVVTMLQENPRLTKLGGNAYKESSPDDAKADRSDRRVVKPVVNAEPKPTPVPRSKLSMVQMLLKVFFGHVQRGDTTYFVIQGFAWQEYGAYMGPIVALFVICSPLVARRQWPWMVVAAACFLTAMGNFARFSPWAILHMFPVMSNARCPTRFLMPFTLATSLLAGFSFDAIRARFAARESTLDASRRPVSSRMSLIVVGLLIACAADMIWVSRTSLWGAFTEPPPATINTLPKIVTIKGAEMSMLLPMFENKDTRDGYEEAHIPIKAKAIEEPGYLGESGFIPAGSTTPSGPSTTPVEIVAWTPSTFTVHVKTSEPGSVFINQNWDRGWRASAPFVAASKNGLVGADVTAGDHTIQFSYRPTTLTLGALISLVSVVAAGAWVVVDARRARGVQASPATDSTTA